ncbi:MAG: c-type cytochrome [Solirubrobacterales bacterium]
MLALVALGATVVVASGCGTSSANTERGRSLFRQKCGGCHTLAQAGTTGVQGPNLDDAFAAARAVGQDSDTVEGVVRAQVENPRPSNGDPAVSMPADIVTGQDLNDVAAYVGEWAGVPGAAPPEVAGGPGAQVFANNGCGGCHKLEGVEGAGGTTGPDLSEVLPGQSPSKIETDIVDPNKEIAQGYPANVMPETFGQTLSEEELKQLVEFLVEKTSKGG